jgi:hypothetical protein
VRGENCMIDIIEFKEFIREMLRTEIEEDDEKLTVNIEGKQFSIKKDYFLELIGILDSRNTDDETLTYDDHYYEVLTRGENFLSPRLMNNETIKKEDISNGITYEYKSCSDEYIIFIINKIHEAGLISESFRRIRRGTNSLFYVVRKTFEETSNQLIDLIRVMIPRFETVRVSSSHIKSKEELEILCNSFLFQMGYNLNYAVVEIKFLDEFLRTNRLLGLRRASLDEMEAPKRKYTSDLIYHYQMALSAEGPMLQFLSYYHIMEHFFEKIYNDEIVKIIEKKITSPQFSAKREKDIKTLMSLISKKIKERGDSYTFNEQEALTLTLSRYINIDELRTKLNEYDEKLVRYYKENEVLFSKGDRFNINQNEAKTFSNLSLRIYKTRNAIVHSKDGDKAKFTPFTDDKYLINEIPLMRFIAEDIIIETSTLI